MVLKHSSTSEIELEFFINGTIDIPLLKKIKIKIIVFVKNTVPILRFVYQIAVVAVQEGGYSYRSSSEDKNGSKTCEGRFKSRILRYIYISISHE